MFILVTQSMQQKFNIYRLCCCTNRGHVAYEILWCCRCITAEGEHANLPNMFTIFTSWVWPKHAMLLTSQHCVQLVAVCAARRDVASLCCKFQVAQLAQLREERNRGGKRESRNKWEQWLLAHSFRSIKHFRSLSAHFDIACRNNGRQHFSTVFGQK